ncbi:insulinase family protein [Marinilabiliaceae bacterium ANBcel2]|nr:insulinase family protein [Marinilabiliaceae bacterium ANBcel2]
MKRFLTRSFFILLFSSVLPALFSQNLSKDKIPLHPDVRKGVLDNGLTYYVKSNSEPENRASFYIVQNVGALLEEDHQDGLAHFVEHMAFNGTKHFPEKELLSTLERHGVAFGRNINAYTSYNETVYNISDVPINRPMLLDTCLLILKDWSNGLLLTDEEIDLERGVILEEWRTRRNANVRMREQWLPVLLKDSKYAKRDVIGDTTVIKHHDPDVLRDFYHKWYRTDLQAVVIIGDFDAEKVEEKVIERFSKIPAVEDAPERPLFEIPEKEGTEFVLATDREATNTVINIYIPRRNSDFEKKTLTDLRNSYIESLYNRMSQNRIQEILQQGTPPFINGHSQTSSFLRGYDTYTINVVANQRESKKGLKRILIETERIKRHGFTPTELERAKADILSGLESRYNERDKIDNDTYARMFQQNYLTNAAAPSIEFEYEFANNVMQGITAEEVSEMANKWIKDDNRTIVITGPEDDDHLTKKEAFAVIDSIKEMEIEPYEDEETVDELITKTLPGSQIINTKNIDQLDAVEWTFENGTKVIYRHADYNKDNVSLYGYSKGGSSIWDDQYVPNLMLINNLIDFYGVGDFSATTLQRMLSGKNVSISPFINTYREGLQGSSAPRDFETLMELLYLYFEEPRFDEDAHNAIMGRYRSTLMQMQNDPRKIQSDTLSSLLTDNHLRVRKLDNSLLDEISLEDIENIYNDRIQDASDFTFFIVGNIEKERVKELSKKYIGSLNSTNREEEWIDRGIRFPTGKQENIIELPLEVPKATVHISFASKTEYSPLNNMYMRTLRGVLNLRYIDTIREEEGGTYGTSVNWSLNRKPVEEGQIQISFETDPDRVDNLKPIVYREIQRIIEEGPRKEDFEKTVENILKDREQNRRRNAFWMNSLQNFYLKEINYADPDNYENIIKSMTPKEFQSFVKSFFENANVVDVLFIPEDEELLEGAEF